jgi:hypothetical protein
MHLFLPKRQKTSRFFLIAIVSMEAVPLVVLNAAQRSGIRLIQDHAEDSIQYLGRVGKAF